jgi:hypothetical protein
MAIRRTTITVTGATGGAGAATATANSDAPVCGIIMAVHLAYTDSPPAGTTDVTIAEATNSPAMSVLTVTDGATDGWRFPMAQAVSQAGATLTNQGYPIAVSDYLKVTIAQANDADGVVVTIVYEDGE